MKCACGPLAIEAEYKNEENETPNLKSVIRYPGMPILHSVSEVGAIFGMEPANF